MLIVKKGNSRATLEDRLKKLNKVLVKYGYEQASIVGEREILEVVGTPKEIDAQEVEDLQLSKLLGLVKFRSYEFQIQIPVERVGKDGTRFLASLEFGSKEAGARISKAYEGDTPENRILDTILLQLARSNKNECDHCHTNRVRNHLFLFEKDGQVLTIGSNCAREWYGIEIESFLKAYRSVSNFSDEEEDYGYGSHEAHKALWVQETILYAMASIDRQGFRSTKTDHGTAEDAVLCYDWNHDGRVRSCKSKPETLSYYNEDYHKFGAMLEQMIKWYEGFNPNSLFDHNLRSGLLDLSLSANMIPWVIQRWMTESKIEFKIGSENGVLASSKVEIVESPNQFVAPEGEKTEIRAQIVFTKAIDNDFGTSYMIKMASEKGEAVWFSSNFNFENCNFNDLVKGTWVSIKGRIKKHDTYQGKAQTVMTRCKLTKEA